MAMREDDHPTKRRKLNASLPKGVVAPIECQNQDVPHKGLDRPISPPPSKRKSPVVPKTLLTQTWGFDDVPSPKSALALLPANSSTEQVTARKRDDRGGRRINYVQSPVQLTHIEDMAPHQNVDATGLRDILGDPMIKECWNFNFLFDIDFVMKQFDGDVRDMVKVKIIHGFWKNDDARRIGLLEAAERYPNIELHHAYIPDPFGTHHSKMLVLFRHDDHAQVIIHTANMISRDWGNMTQAVWCSPLLPLLDPTAAIATKSGAMAHPIGCGERFKVDFLRYLKAYGKRIFSLTTQLMDYDFSPIRAAFIGSAPSRQKPASSRPSEQTSFGWLGLQEVLSTVPIQAQNDETSLPSHVIVQVSSIATLGAAPTWLTQFQSVLAHSAVKDPTPTKPSSSFFAKRDTSSTQQDKASTPKFNVIFPTPEEIRTSLDGWASGGSIHMKLQSQQQQKQLEYMHPLFCHWKSPSAKSHDTSKALRRGEALRGPAAPHIKTYIRFSTLEHKTIDWAMVTSANLSKQAWGDVVNKKDEIWIQSWEAGVIVWPALFAEPDAAEEVVMVPVFGKDMPGPEDLCDTAEDSEEEDGVTSDKTVVGFRMPYDLPLSPYTANDKPWCATMQYSEPDWKGLAWGGY